MISINSRASDTKKNLPYLYLSQHCRMKSAIVSTCSIHSSFYLVLFYSQLVLFCSVESQKDIDAVVHTPPSCCCRVHVEISSSSRDSAIFAVEIVLEAETRSLSPPNV